MSITGGDKGVSSGTVLPNLVLPVDSFASRLTFDDPVATELVSVALCCTVETLCKQLLRDAIRCCSHEQYWSALPANVLRGKRDTILPRFIQIALRTNEDLSAVMSWSPAIAACCEEFLDASTSSQFEEWGITPTSAVTSVNTSADTVVESGVTTGGGDGGGWQRRKDDVITEVELVQLLLTLHPIYRLPSDTLMFMVSLIRGVMEAALTRIQSHFTTRTVESVEEVVEAALSGLLSGKLRRDCLDTFRDCVSIIYDSYTPPATVKTTVQLQRGCEVGHSKSFTLSRSDRIVECVSAFCKHHNLNKKEFIGVLNGKAVQDSDTLNSLHVLSKSVTVFVVDQKWWSHHRRDEARRGHLTSTKANEQAVKAFKRNAHSKLQQPSHIVHSPSQQSMSVQQPPSQQPQPPHDVSPSRYSPITASVATVKPRVLLSNAPVSDVDVDDGDGDDDNDGHAYDDDEFEADEEVSPDVRARQPSLKLLQQKRSQRRSRHSSRRRHHRTTSSSSSGIVPSSDCDELSVASTSDARVAGLDKLVVIGPGGGSDSVTSKLVQQHAAHEAQSPTVSNSHHHGARSGFGFRAPSGVINNSGSPNIRRLIRTPDDGQLPDLSMLSKLPSATKRPDYGHRYVSPTKRREDGSVTRDGYSSVDSGGSPIHARHTTIPHNVSHEEATPVTQVQQQLHEVKTSLAMIKGRGRRQRSSAAVPNVMPSIIPAPITTSTSPPQSQRKADVTTGTMTVGDELAKEAKGQLLLLKRRSHESMISAQGDVHKRTASRSPLRRRAVIKSQDSDELTVITSSTSPHIHSAVDSDDHEKSSNVKLPALTTSTTHRQSGSGDTISDRLSLLRKKRHSDRSTNDSQLQPLPQVSSPQSQSQPYAIHTSASMSSLTTDVAQQLLFASEESISALTETLTKVERLRKHILATRLPPVQSLLHPVTPSHSGDSQSVNASGTGTVMSLSPLGIEEDHSKRVVTTVSPLTEPHTTASLRAALLDVQESARRSETVLKVTRDVISVVEPHGLVLQSPPRLQSPVLSPQPQADTMMTTLLGMSDISLGLSVVHDNKQQQQQQQEIDAVNTMLAKAPSVDSVSSVKTEEMKDTVEAVLLQQQSQQQQQQPIDVNVTVTEPNTTASDKTVKAKGTVMIEPFVIDDSDVSNDSPTINSSDDHVDVKGSDVKSQPPIAITSHTVDSVIEASHSVSQLSHSSPSGSLSIEPINDETRLPMQHTQSKPTITLSSPVIMIPPILSVPTADSPGRIHSTVPVSFHGGTTAVLTPSRSSLLQPPSQFHLDRSVTDSPHRDGASSPAMVLTQSSGIDLGHALPIKTSSSSHSPPHIHSHSGLLGPSSSKSRLLSSPSQLVIPSFSGSIDGDKQGVSVAVKPAQSPLRATIVSEDSIDEQSSQHPPPQLQSQAVSTFPSRSSASSSNNTPQHSDSLNTGSASSSVVNKSFYWGSELRHAVLSARLGGGTPHALGGNTVSNVGSSSSHSTSSPGSPTTTTTTVHDRKLSTSQSLPTFLEAPVLTVPQQSTNDHTNSNTTFVIPPPDESSMTLAQQVNADDDEADDDDGGMVPAVMPIRVVEVPTRTQAQQPHQPTRKTVIAKHDGPKFGDDAF